MTTAKQKTQEIQIVHARKFCTLCHQRDQFTDAVGAMMEGCAHGCGGCHLSMRSRIKMKLNLYLVVFVRTSCRLQKQFTDAVVVACLCMMEGCAHGCGGIHSSVRSRMKMKPNLYLVVYVRTSCRLQKQFTDAVVVTRLCMIEGCAHGCSGCHSCVGSRVQMVSICIWSYTFALCADSGNNVQMQW